MKQNNFFATIAIAASMSFFFSSCNSGDEKKGTEPVTMDTAAAKPMTPPPAAEPPSFLLIKHKVANYTKWKPAYDSDDSMRVASGLSNYVIGRGAGSDSNTVFIALKMTDVAKAKEMASSPGLKDKMKKGGVTGVPVIAFVKTVLFDTTSNSSINRVMITHKVKDWDAWKKEFDSHKQARMDAGLSDRAVGYSVDDNHLVTLVFAITDMEKAKAFMMSKDLKDKMTAAGVEGPPTVFYYTVVQKYK